MYPVCFPIHAWVETWAAAISWLLWVVLYIITVGKATAQ